MKNFAFIETLLTLYVWLVFWIPLGNWNSQAGAPMLPDLLAGRGLEADDLFTLAFVTIPAAPAWLAYRRNSKWLTVGALAFNLVWAALQVQSWWIPYILDTELAWQLRYSEGPTTKILPSLPGQPAPDGMYFVIHALLLIALVAGTFALKELRTSKQR